MPDIPSLLRRLWPWQPDHLSESLDRAREQLGDHLSTASQELGCTLDDAAHSLGWGEACTKADTPPWPETPGEDMGWNRTGWSGNGQAAGGGGGGFGGASAPQTRYEIPISRLAQTAAALAITGLLVTGAVSAIQSGSTAAAEPSHAASSGGETAPVSINGVSPERLVQAEIVTRERQNGVHQGLEGQGNAPVTVSQAPPSNRCAERDDWYLFAPTPTPTPLPQPLGCQVGRVVREQPKILDFFWQPEHPTLGSQQPTWRTQGNSLIDFAITAQGGRFYEGVNSGNGCHLVKRDDPLIRIEMDWVLLPPSVGWIEGELSQRYTEAYSRAQERGIQCAIVWEGRSQHVEIIYPDWQPLDPGIYGVRVHLYTGGDGVHPGTNSLIATPVPVYLRDSTLGE